MSPFEEPQPRKNNTVEQDSKKVIGGIWPTYERQGGEANWREVKAQADIAEAYRHTPLMVLPDHTQFELRKTALEAALGLGLEPNHHGELFWANLQTFEDYLRDGTKPS